MWLYRGSEVEVEEPVGASHGYGITFFHAKPSVQFTCGTEKQGNFS